MAEQFRNLVELCERSCAKYADRPLYGTKEDGAWTWTTYREFHELVDRLRGGLASLGVGKGDRIAIIADNRVEWAVAAYATYGLEAEFVPMYQAQRPKEWQFILNDCAARVVFAANRVVFDAIGAMRSDLRALTHVIGLEGPASDSSTYASLLNVGAKAPVPARSPDPKSISGFIYTSGTTGKPKGVMLSHENIASNLTALHEVFTFEPEDRSLSFLPWAHAYGQTGEVHGMLSMGCSVAINDKVENLIANLAEVKPTILLAVPRIFNRIYDTVSQQIAARPGFLQSIIRGGIQGAIKRAHGEKVGAIEGLELAFDERAIFAKIREKFGGRLKYAISASATLGKDVGDFIDAIGLPVYEGYGLTETSPIVTVNLPGRKRLGSVGRPLPGVRLHVDTSVGLHPMQGEIVVYGPNVMVGYHNRPEENEKALMKDGGFRTGDLGYVDEDGYLYITGRIKELYKLENGKYVMPAPLEEELKLSPYIANVMIYGDGKPANMALVVLAEGPVRKWAEDEGITLSTDLANDAKVRALIGSELELHAKDFKGFEKPKHFVLITEDFTMQNGLLTPTLKLKRRDVLARYDNLIHGLYVK